MHRNLVVVSISSRTSTVAWRELLPLGRATDGALAGALPHRAGIHEALALSIRERTDVYGVAASPELVEPALRDQPEQLAGPLDPGQVPVGPAREWLGARVRADDRLGTRAVRLGTRRDICPDVGAPRLHDPRCTKNTPPPTSVLVHGAFAGSSSWDAVIDVLLDAGRQVIAAANPLRGTVATGPSCSPRTPTEAR